MKTMLIAGAVAASFLCAGCATEGASSQALGKADPPNVTVKNGKRQEVMVGSRLARETRESPELVKTISRKGYQEGKEEKPGSPLPGGG
jgi:Spy/CpxP family protein refolding chaperone